MVVLLPVKIRKMGLFDRSKLCLIVHVHQSIANMIGEAKPAGSTGRHGMDKARHFLFALSAEFNQSDRNL